MKRLLCIALVLLILPIVCGCSKTSVSSNAKAELTFIFAEQNINVTLSDEEAEKVIRILDGNIYNPFSDGIPSCGFDQNISLKVGSRIYAIACDTCNIIQDCGNLKYFSVSQEDMAYIHSLFEKYGGYFPCIQ